MSQYIKLLYLFNFEQYICRIDQSAIHILSDLMLPYRVLHHAFAVELR